MQVVKEFMDAFDRAIFDMVSGLDSNERKGGILAIGNATQKYNKRLIFYGR